MSEILDLAAKHLPPLSLWELRMLAAHIPKRYFEWTLPARDPASFCSVGHSLMNKGLIAWHPDPRDSRTIITEMGLASLRARSGDI